MGKRDVFLQICVLLCILGQFIDAVPYRQFYPFGEQRGDTVLDPGDDISSSEIPLTTPIVFYDKRYTGIFVNNNGHLSFETELPRFQSDLVLPIGYKIIAALLSDVDTTYAGAVYYREETDDEALLQRAAIEIRAHFDDYATFVPRALFIATYDNVGFYNANDTFLNTFQVVVASDGSNSFAILSYLDDGIQWIQSQGKQYEDPPAQAGFDSGEGRRHFKVGPSGTKKAFELATGSNMDLPGVWMYHIGYVREIEKPKLDTGTVIFDPDNEDSNSCVAGSNQCHVNARCLDYDSGFCCQCIPPFFGNGVNCIKIGPQRLNGKLSGRLNGEEINDVDMHSYVITSDGRVYVVISRIPSEIGNNMLTLNTIGGVIGWMFGTTTTPSARNGYMYSGGQFNRTVVIDYQNGKDVVTIRDTFFGHDAQNNIRLSTFINGSVPPLENGDKITMDNYVEEYTQSVTGQNSMMSSYSVRKYRVNDIARRFTISQNITFKDCPHDPVDKETLRLSVSRNYFIYDDLEGVVRYAMTNKISSRTRLDPCANIDCGEHGECVPTSTSYECRCKPGFQGDGTSCVDIDECIGSNICDQNALCYNVPGSFLCRCISGFSGDGKYCQRDVQYCGDDICLENARCVYNSDLMRPQCECRSGFTGDGVNSCSPTQLSCNEVDICHEDAECLFNDDAQEYQCECNEGYSGDGVTCEQYDTDCNCGDNAECLIDPDSLVRRCQCKAGFTGDGNACTPIIDNTICNDCHRNAECALDIDNSRYVCRCLPGFSGDGYQCLEQEYDDCRSQRNCDVNADCVNDPFISGYRCLCKNGFTGDGYTCERDQCISNEDCDANAVCDIDPRDSSRYTCRCQPGYEGDGRVCRQRVVPCNQVNNCAANADCVYNPTELSYRCRCLPGYEGDGYSCRPRGYDCRRDSRICDPNANCVLNVDTFICVCREGFHGDGRRCRAMDVENNYLVLSQGYSVFRVPYIKKEDDPGERLMYKPNQLIIGLDSDCMEGDLYWTDVYGGSIYKAKLDGSDDATTVVSGLSSPEGVAIDWSSRNMYWTDSGLNIIDVAKLDGTMRKNLFSTDLMNPRAIVLDPARGMMYWTDWNRNGPKIESAHMDGQARKVVVGTDLGLPNALTINTHTQQICWGDAGDDKHSIECVRTDGQGRRVVTMESKYPFSLAYISNNLYWTDWQVQGISNIDQNGGDLGEAISVPVGGNGKLYGITAVRATCPHAGYNPCAVDNGGCQYLCLPGPSGGRTCSCPDGVDPNDCQETA